MEFVSDYRELKNLQEINKPFPAGRKNSLFLFIKIPPRQDSGTGQDKPHRKPKLST
jgi:hypothetical protein